ncbi:MAG: 16S rRNA (guanine(966)-N(2))-methyltransferase RsmD [Breznakia sp.]
MRVIAGVYRSRNIQTLAGKQTRPTSDKVRGAVFSSINNCFFDGHVLDVFCGSGAIALEALSRGAKRVDAIECHNGALQVIKRNMESLHIHEEMKVYASDYTIALEQLKTKRYAFIYIDPPYAFEDIKHILLWIDKHHMLLKGGIMVVESGDNVWEEASYQSFKQYKEKNYRKTKLTFYKGGE